MDMEVRHRLPRGGADIYPDIVAVRVICLLDEGAAPGDEIEEGCPFLVGRLEIGGDMPIRDDEEVARADRVAVGACIGTIVARDDLFWERSAERTGHIQRSHL